MSEGDRDDGKEDSEVRPLLLLLVLLTKYELFDQDLLL